MRKFFLLTAIVEILAGLVLFFATHKIPEFNNCLHFNEPNCAIKKALENNQISNFRYNNYLVKLF